MEVVLKVLLLFLHLCSMFASKGVMSRGFVDWDDKVVCFEAGPRLRQGWCKRWAG